MADNFDNDYLNKYEKKLKLKKIIDICYSL
jgi:hypothetical protein